jgi:hypothetical protein
VLVVQVHQRESPELKRARKKREKSFIENEEVPYRLIF